jgi:hypothetical protein
LLLISLLSAPAGCAAAEGASSAPVSVIQVPLELDLAPLFEAAESALPTQAGHWPGWRDWHGIATRYRAWRGPLSLRLRGDHVHAQAHVRYQVQMRKGLIAGIGLKTGCGVDEPPRQALIGALARLEWGPDWSLRPRFRVLPTRLLDRCEVTIADIDVSPLVGRLFEARIETALTEAVRALAPRLQRLRGEAADAWRGMQTPRELAPGLWLRLRPLGLALAPPRGAGSRVHTAVWLALRAGLTGESAPAAAPTPLPALLPYQPSRPGLRFSLELELDYPKVSAALAGRLAGQAAEVEGRRARLEAVDLSARGDDLMVDARLSGDLAGRLTIFARPGFDAAAQALRLEDVEFVFDAADANQPLLTDLFHGLIRGRIESEANALLAERTQGLRSSLAEVLADILPPEVRPDVSGLRVTDLRIGVGEKGLRLSGTAAGNLTLGTSGDSGSM